jgi:hypothetical protein
VTLRQGRRRRVLRIFPTFLALLVKAKIGRTAGQKELLFQKDRFVK